MATKSNPPQQRLKYLGNVIKIPGDKVNAVLSGDINRIILPEDTDFSFNSIYAYKQGSKSSEEHIGVFAVIARYPLYIATSRVYIPIMGCRLCKRRGYSLNAIARAKCTSLLWDVGYVNTPL